MTKQKRIPRCFGKTGHSPIKLHDGIEAAALVNMPFELFQTLHVNGKGPQYYNVRGVAFFDVYHLDAFALRMKFANSKSSKAHHDA